VPPGKPWVLIAPKLLGNSIIESISPSLHLYLGIVNGSSIILDLERLDIAELGGKGLGKGRLRVVDHHYLEGPAIVLAKQSAEDEEENEWEKNREEDGRTVAEIATSQKNGSVP